MENKTVIAMLALLFKGRAGDNVSTAQKTEAKKD